jgi:CRISPR/Cas system-associated endonuclease Cas1
MYKILCESFGWSLQSRKRERFVPGIIFGPRGYSEINAAINFLHRLQLSQACRSNHGRELVGTRGFLHKAKDYGLLLDLIEPLKIIDREFLLLAVKRGQVKKELFERNEEGLGTYFYFPNPAGAFRLEKIGTEADLFEMWYSRKRMTMSEAFDTACKNLIVAMEKKKPYEPLIIEPVGGWKKEVLEKLEISG